MAVSTYPVPQPISKELRARGKYFRSAQITRRLRARNHKSPASTGASWTKYSALNPSLFSASAGANTGDLSQTAGGYPQSAHRQFAAVNRRPQERQTFIRSVRAGFCVSM